MHEHMRGVEALCVGDEFAVDGPDVAVRFRYDDDAVSENGSSSESGDGPDDGETSGLSSIPGTDPLKKDGD